MDLNKLSLGDRIVAGAGIVLFIDLLFLPWHHVSIGLGAFRATANRTAIESPNSFWGVLAFLLTAAVVAVVLLRRLSTVKLPDLPVPQSQAVFYGTIGIAALLLIKLVIETSYLGYGSWLGILLAGGMVYGGYLISKESESGASGGTSYGSPPPPTS